MTTSFAAPSGALLHCAVSTEEWQPNDGDRHYRNFDGEMREVATGARFGPPRLAVFSYGVQLDDGRIDDGTMERVFEAPRITFLEVDADGRQKDTGITLTGDAARGRVYAYAVLDDTNHANDEILIGTPLGDDEASGSLLLMTPVIALMIRANRSERRYMERRWAEWIAGRSIPEEKPNFYSGSGGSSGS